jgi:HSP20 family protein
MDRLVETYVREPVAGFEWPFGPRDWSPPLDVGENEHEIVVRAELPGINPADIQVTVSGGQLILSGEKKPDAAQAKDFYQTESRYGTFRRAVPLPDSADPDGVDAEYAGGVLWIRIRKTATAPPKRVEVKVRPETAGPAVVDIAQPPA